MKWEDLPADIQRQIRAGKATTKATNAISGRDPRSIRPQRGVDVPQPPQPRQRQSWKCHDCGERFEQWASAQRHANDNGHVRIELVLPGDQ